jgi:predicted RNA-binding Zn-ribbon protein involved in translation (DUF1610 family)
MKRDPMTCPKCGAEMNCHAEKPVDPLGAKEAAAATKGTLVEEIHLCPSCGVTESRRLIA